jgi:hypothetical protein
MPRPLLFVLSLAAGAVIATGLAACGSDDDEGVIPPESASAMLAALQDAEGADCDTIREAASTVANEAAGLPDSEARTGVIDGAENLAALAGEGQGCETGPTGPEGPTEDTTDETTETAPTTTTEETTTTTTEEEEKPPKEPKEPEPAPDEGDDGDDGGPPVTPPGQGGEPPGQAPPESGGVGGDED